MDSDNYVLYDGNKIALKDLERYLSEKFNYLSNLSIKRLNRNTLSFTLQSCNTLELNYLISIKDFFNVSDENFKIKSMVFGDNKANYVARLVIEFNIVGTKFIDKILESKS